MIIREWPKNTPSPFYQILLILTLMDFILFSSSTPPPYAATVALNHKKIEKKITKNIKN